VTFKRSSGAESGQHEALLFPRAGISVFSAEACCAAADATATGQPHRFL